jgi:NTE family protein
MMAGVPTGRSGDKPRHHCRSAVETWTGPAAAARRQFGWRLAKERILARGRPDKSLARFERIALVLSGGEALGAYQAGAYAALEKSGVRPNWIAGTAIGAVNAAIIAGNLPHERVLRMRQFWHEVSRRAAQRSPRRLGRWAQKTAGRFISLLRRGAGFTRPEAVVSASELRELIAQAVDFERVNSGAVRVVLGAVNLATGAETFFDNDRHVLGLDHVLAGTPLPGLPPVAIDRQLFGGSAVPVSALDEARPADTLCFAVDGYDPAPGGHGGISRTAREIAALRRTHDLRRMIGLLGERLPPTVHGEIDIRRCLAEASDATMTILHLVHEGNVADLAAKMADFSLGTVTRRWKAGERDVATSLAHPRWLAPPPRLSGVVVHEVRDGVVAPPR